jgi:hypothetical protein
MRENVVGLPIVRAFFEHGTPLSPQALAALIGGTYGALVYLTPLLGGMLADWLLGRTPTIILGALLMALGHFLMAFEQPFLLALVCLMLGSGCFKGNIASQVGALYPEGDNRRADAFQVFYLGINAGVIASGFVVGTLEKQAGFHWGFAAAGIGMLISIVIYLTGRKGFPSDPPLRQRAQMKVERPAMTRDEVGPRGAAAGHGPRAGGLHRRQPADLHHLPGVGAAERRPEPVRPADADRVPDLGGLHRLGRDPGRHGGVLALVGDAVQGAGRVRQDHPGLLLRGRRRRLPGAGVGPGACGRQGRLRMAAGLPPAERHRLRQRPAVGLALFARGQPQGPSPAR